MSDQQRISDWEELEGLTHEELVIECAHQRWLMENLKANLVMLANDEGNWFDKGDTKVATDEWARHILRYLLDRPERYRCIDATEMEVLGLDYRVCERTFDEYCERTGYSTDYSEELKEHPDVTVWEELDEMGDEDLIILTVKTRKGLEKLKNYLPRLYDDTAECMYPQYPPEKWLNLIIGYLRKKGMNDDEISERLGDYGVMRYNIREYTEDPEYDISELLDDDFVCPEPEAVKHILGKPLVKVTSYPDIPIPDDIAAMEHDDMVVEIVKLARYRSDIRHKFEGMDSEENVPTIDWNLFRPLDHWYSQVESKLEGDEKVTHYGINSGTYYAHHPEEGEFPWSDGRDRGWNDYMDMEEEFSADPWRFLDIQDDGFLRYKLTELRNQTDSMKEHIRAIVG